MTPHKTTPYELRASLLELAFQVCLKKAQAESFANQLQEKPDSVNLLDANTIPVTVDEIISVAEKFNTFVSKNENKGTNT